MTIDFAAIKAKLAQTKQGLKKAGTTIKPKAGKNRYVILPPFNGVDWHHNFGQHYIKDGADTTKAVYICASRTHDADCPVCNSMAELQRTVGASDPAISELIKKSYARQEFLVGVLALDSDTPDTPQVLCLGKKAFEQLVVLIESWTEQVFDPSRPQIVVIERTGTGINDTSYTVQPSPERYAFKKKIEPINLSDFVKMESEAAEKKSLLALAGIVKGGSVASLPAPARSKDVPSTPAHTPEFEDVPDSVSGVGIDASLDDLLGDLEAA